MIDYKQQKTNRMILSKRHGFPRGAVVKNPPADAETQVQSLGREDPLEKKMATSASILAWENPMDRGAWQAAVHGVAKSQR